MPTRSLTILLMPLAFAACTNEQKAAQIERQIEAEVEKMDALDASGEMTMEEFFDGMSELAKLDEELKEANTGLTREERLARREAEQEARQAEWEARQAEIRKNAAALTAANERRRQQERAEAEAARERAHAAAEALRPQVKARIDEVAHLYDQLIQAHQALSEARTDVWERRWAADRAESIAVTKENYIYTLRLNIDSFNLSRLNARSALVEEARAKVLQDLQEATDELRTLRPESR